MTNSDSGQVPRQGLREGVSIVVPCYNEEAGLYRLQKKLSEARVLVGQKYRVYFILVDDGSKDRTWARMKRIFVRDADVRLIRHKRNRGIGAAILTGIRQARTNIVCSIDSDCSYDPCELAKMVPMLAPGVDLVTASPYHPEGQVVNVPSWRLILSKSASRLYRLMLKNKLHTYTSCFRVYRRTAILKLALEREGFLGVAELISKLDHQNSIVMEYPVRLATRVHGVSKMKTLRVLAGHVQLLGELLMARLHRGMGRSNAQVHSTQSGN